MAFTKTTTDAIQYEINWQSSLNAGDYIIDSAWDVPSGLNNASARFTPTTTSIFLSGGTSGAGYLVQNTVTTFLGETIRRAIQITVQLNIILP